MKQSIEHDSNRVSTGIGSLRQSSLHSSIIGWYAQPGDRLEAKVDDYIVDIVRGDLLIEVQTGNLSAIRAKLFRLAEKHPVRLVYPLPVTKWIVKVSRQGGEIVSRRKSPKTGRLTDLFSELVYIAEIINCNNFTLEVLLVEITELRCDDGKGSWRRKGVSIQDRELIEVKESILFTQSKDYLALLPQNLAQPFSNRMLAQALGIPIYQARRMTYALRRMGAIEMTAKCGNALLYMISK